MSPSSAFSISSQIHYCQCRAGVFTLGQLQQWTIKVRGFCHIFAFASLPDPHGGRWEKRGMSDTFLLVWATEKSICRGMFLTLFWQFVYMDEYESAHMFASRNGESRQTRTFAMTLPFHPWNEVKFGSTLAWEKKIMVSLAGAIFLLIILTQKKESEVCACISFVAINTYVFVYLSSQSN